MGHTHFWNLDSKGLGLCECGEVRQFKNSWDANPMAFNRPVDQVVREMKEIYRQYHNLRPTSPRPERRDVSLSQRLY